MVPFNLLHYLLNGSVKDLVHIGKYLTTFLLITNYKNILKEFIAVMKQKEFNVYQIHQTVDVIFLVFIYYWLLVYFSYLSLNSSHMGSHFDDKNISDDHLMDMYYVPVLFILFCFLSGYLIYIYFIGELVSQKIWLC